MYPGIRSKKKIDIKNVDSMIRYPIKYKSVNKDHHPKKCRLIITDSG